jgi:hypothetical protein
MQSHIEIYAFPYKVYPAQNAKKGKRFCSVVGLSHKPKKRRQWLRSLLALRGETHSSQGF